MSYLGLTAEQWRQRGKKEKDENKDYRTALDCYDNAIRLDPRVAAYHGGRAQCLRQLKSYNEAIASYDRAISLSDPTDPLLAQRYHYRGWCLIDVDNREALRYVERAWSLDPTSCDILNTRGHILESLGRTAEAGDCWRASLRTDSSNVFARDRLESLRREAKRAGEYADSMRESAEREKNYQKAIKEIDGSREAVWIKQAAYKDAAEKRYKKDDDDGCHIM